MYSFKSVKTCMWKPEIVSAPALAESEKHVAKGNTGANISRFKEDYVPMYNEATA